LSGLYTKKGRPGIPVGLSILQILRHSYGFASIAANHSLDTLTTHAQNPPNVQGVQQSPVQEEIRCGAEAAGFIRHLNDTGAHPRTIDPRPQRPACSTPLDLWQNELSERTSLN
jgi:hypothetical protein